METFFSDQLGQSLEMFGLAHILLVVGFVATVVLLWVLAPRIRNKRYEKWVRFTIIALVIAFEWRVFESRMLTASLSGCRFVRSLLLATFAVAFKKENCSRSPISMRSGRFFPLVL